MVDCVISENELQHGIHRWTFALLSKNGDGSGIRLGVTSALNGQDPSQATGGLAWGLRLRDMRLVRYDTHTGKERVVGERVLPPPKKVAGEGPKFVTCQVDLRHGALGFAVNGGPMAEVMIEPTPLRVWAGLFHKGDAIRLVDYEEGSVKTSSPL